jgi:hypothetical protein
MRLIADEWQLQPHSIWLDIVAVGSIEEDLPIKLFKLTTKPAAHLDHHLLHDLGISRIDSEFARPASGAFERVENARTFLDKWLARNVPEIASLDKKSAMQLVDRCVNDAGERYIQN